MKGGHQLPNLGQSEKGLGSGPVFAAYPDRRGRAEGQNRPPLRPNASYG